jgi:alkaline phosphatase
MRFVLYFVCLLLATSCNESPDAKTTTTKPKQPKNIILLIGDGMGLSEISSTYFFNEQASNFDRFNSIGLIKTSASSDLVTDSAAGATAFATGKKTYNGAISVDPDSLAIETIVERISKDKIATGVISTSSIVHATPAGFYAHEKSRRSYEAIAKDLVASDIDFFAGGGQQFFNKRKDGKDLYAALEQKGFVISTEALPSAPYSLDILKKQAILLAADEMPKMLDGRGDFLPNATQLGINYLADNEEGFFLMIEGSQIDWGGHDNDADYLISELIDFDKTIGVALDFAKSNGETLVIVTADHETGGFTLSADAGDYNKIKPTFSTSGHSATLIPVFAFGPGEAEFAGIYENTGIYHKMMKLLGYNTSEGNKE